MTNAPLAHNSPWTGLDNLVEPLASGSLAGGIESFLDITRRAARFDENGAFSAARIAVLADLSESLLSHPLLRRDPATVALAYWMRPGSVQRLKQEYGRRLEGDPTLTLVPVGRVFHVAPANVDTLFMYSWGLAFLCGNASVVRLSRERGTVVEAILEVIRAVADRQPAFASGNRFVTYAHDDRATAALSAWCSHRVVWGGDDTVKALRGVPLNTHASERVFGSKFSYSVFSAAAFASLGEAACGKLASAFFNDLFWFDQMACSSPHLLFWVGDSGIVAPAIAAFDAALELEVERRHYMTSAANAVHRRAFAFELAADADVRVDLSHPGFVPIAVHDDRGLARIICGGGLLRHARLDAFAQLAAFADEGDQTVTHFGFPAEDLAALAVPLGARGVDRLVPVGEALAFDSVWDGFDLLSDFTRRVRVKPA